MLVVAVLALLGLDTVRAFYFSQTDQGQMNQGQMGEGQFGQDQNGQGQFGQGQNGQGQGGQGWIDQGQFGQDQNGQGQGGRGQGQFVQDQDRQGQGRTGQGYFGQDQNGQGQRGQVGTDRGQSGPNQNQNYQNFFNQYQNREVVDLGQIGQTVNLDQISQQLNGQGLDLGQLTQSLNGQNGNIQNGRYVNTQIVRGELTQIPGTNAFAIIVNNPGMNVMIQNMAITAVTTIQKWDMMFFLAGKDVVLFHPACKIERLKFVRFRKLYRRLSCFSFSTM